MSEAIAFDTLRFVKNLTANGFTEQQAEALAREQVHLLNSNLATKSDIWEIKADMQVVRADMQAVKVDLLKWMIGAMTTHAAFIAALVWYLFTSVSGG
ncbi:MAG: DUF1640 domain-containing protein [Gammaproteobacteria bacterium]|nr:DUF1640 domain-containing protein [Gammaproteobacteria bacterium]